MKYLAGFLMLLMCSCSQKLVPMAERTSFENSAVIESYGNIAESNQAHFIIKQNYYFHFYRSLMDSVPNTQFAGKFTRSGDTLNLSFFNAEGRRILGNKAFIDRQTNQVIFFDKMPGNKRSWKWF